MPAHNRFLEGSFAPVTEEITAFGLPVTGSLPAELAAAHRRRGGPLESILETQDLYDNHFDDSPVWQQALAARS